MNAKEAVGNWKKFDSFSWYNAPEDADSFMHYTIQTRDSELITQANAKAIKDRMESYEEDAWVENHTHWAGGWVDKLILRVFDSDGNVTPAWEEFKNILDDLENYPILPDAEDYLSTLEYESAIEGIRNAVDRNAVWYDHLPEGWEEEVYCALPSEELEDVDGQGAYPSEESITLAIHTLYSWTVTMDGMQELIEEQEEAVDALRLSVLNEIDNAYYLDHPAEQTIRNIKEILNG